MTRWSWMPMAFLLAAGPVVAQATREGGSVLNLLRVQERLELDREMTGALSGADWQDVRDHYLDVWGFEGRAGQRVTFLLTSDDFDAYLYLVGPGFSQTLADDDGGGGCHARLVVTFLENGTFRVVASSARSGATGVYRIRAAAGEVPVREYSCGGVDPAVLAALPTGNRSIALGRNGTGRLGAADRVGERTAQAWALQGRAGEAVEITMRSDAFDSFLYVVGPGLESPLEDDDGAGDLHARVTVAFPQTGTYKVIASALSGGTGAYELTVGPSRVVSDLTRLTPAGRITAGTAVNGSLGDDAATYDDGKPVQAWTFQGRAGQRVIVSLESSDFDSYLFLAGPGLTTPLYDDDGGEEYNSQITTTLPADGTYYVVASALSRGARGAYRLSVTVQP